MTRSREARENRDGDGDIRAASTAVGWAGVRRKPGAGRVDSRQSLAEGAGKLDLKITVGKQRA